jgi:phage tail sheath protein FI
LEPAFAQFTVPVAGGFDGFDIRLPGQNGVYLPLRNDTQLVTLNQIGSQAICEAVDILSDPDFIDINMLIMPQIYSIPVTSYAANAMLARGDVFYPMEVSGSNVSTVVASVQNRGIDNNYAAAYYPNVNVSDLNPTNQGGIFQLPASAVAAAAIAYNDSVSYPWFAPAGLNRAGLSQAAIGFNVTSLADQLNAAERDQLYAARINPIARFPDQPQGVIWGQKTLQLKNSALNRVNVRRLLIYAKKLIASAAKYLVFEPANATTMTRFKQMVNPILANIQQKQGLNTFMVVMDESNNPPSVIAQNMLVGQIFLVPTLSAEFISLNFIVSPQGTTFSS